MTAAPWYFPSILALFMYGFWGYWGAKATSLIQPLSIAFYSSLGVLLAGAVALFLLDFKPEFCIKGSAYGLLNGLANGLGCLFFIMALRSGPAMPVILITSMYPLITLFLSVMFLKQTITFKQTIGMCFALLALIFLSLE